jgi:hypothetical protein
MRALAAAVAVALVVVLSAGGSTRRSSAVFSVDARQASQVAAIVDFIHAWNTRQLTKALALLAPNASTSDCDYRTHRAVSLRGKTQIASWLRKRFADRDVLTIARIWNENPTEDRVAGVTYDRRRSKLFPGGTLPNGSTKVIFASDGRILTFANGPFGAPPDQQTEVCSP